MLRVAFDFRWPAVVSFGKRTVGKAAEGQRRGIKNRLAGYMVLGDANVRDDLLDSLWTAGRESGHCKGRAHDFDKLAPIHFFAPWGGLLRKFPLQVLRELLRFGELFEAPPSDLPAAAIQLRPDRRQVQVMPFAVIVH